WVRVAVADARQRITGDPTAGAGRRDDLTAMVVQSVCRQASHDSFQKFGNVINATGVILHTSLGRAPLCAAAVAAIADVAAACNLEVDLDTGERRSRGYQLQSAWQRLTGAEAALVVNNNAAATLLALDSLCRGREVIISRGQLIEIGGSFRLPDVFAQSGAILREVGTTNRTSLADYERAIGPGTAALLRVHPSNYQVVGFADSPAIGELAPLAHRYGLACIDDIGSGCLVDTTRYGLPAEPTFRQSLAAGADVVLGSGDKLLGGPQCGILLGHAELVERLGRHPLASAFRNDKLTLAALSATLDAYLRGAAEREIPTLALLAASQNDLLARALRIHDAMFIPSPGKWGDGGLALPDNCKAEIANSKLQIEIARDAAPVGGGSLPGAALPTAVLRLGHRELPVEGLARRLRVGSPRVFGRIQDDELLLDLRSVLPGDDERIVAALQQPMIADI
ncbi:MAG: L-seryl-tRNA(Sec) selenium transferase, partial [Deltaproteobacteria bacterium]